MKNLKKTLDIKLNQKQLLNVNFFLSNKGSKYVSKQSCKQNFNFQRFSYAELYSYPSFKLPSFYLLKFYKYVIYKLKHGAYFNFNSIKKVLFSKFLLILNRFSIISVFIKTGFK